MAIGDTTSGRNRFWGSILGRFGEHFYEIVVQAVVDLPLEVPGKLGMIEVAGVDGKDVCMDGDGTVFQVDQNLNESIRLACGKLQQRVLIEA